MAIRKNTGKQLKAMVKKAFKNEDTVKIIRDGLTYIYLGYEEKRKCDVWAVCEYDYIGLGATSCEFSGSFDSSDKYKVSKQHQYRFNRVLRIRYGDRKNGVLFDIDDIKDSLLLFKEIRDNALVIHDYYHYDKYGDCIGVSSLRAS